MTRAVTIRNRENARTIALVGDVYAYLASGDDTGGKYALIEAIVPPGGGPPPHVHRREEEGFYILEGAITFIVDGAKRVATAGTFANLPVGTPHTFRNETDQPARMLILASPAGLERMFLEAGREVPAGTTSTPPPTEVEIERLLAAAPAYGVEIQTPEH